MLARVRWYRVDVTFRILSHCRVETASIGARSRGIGLGGRFADPADLVAGRMQRGGCMLLAALNLFRALSHEQPRRHEQY